MFYRLNLLGRRPRISWFTWHVRRTVQPELKGLQVVRVSIRRGTELDILPWQDNCVDWVA